MTDSDVLHVWHESQLVGVLRRSATNQIGFQYSTDWLQRDGFPISVSLPLKSEPFLPEEAVAHRYFANLLPEGRVRERIARDLKLADSDFDLLRAIGGECAGALSILPDDRKPTGEAHYQELSPDALRDLIVAKGRIYARTSDAERPPNPPRLSLAGAQDKCPVLLKDGQFFLSQGEAPSTHIIKFSVPDYRHVPAYEAILTDLARRIGLKTNSVEFRRLQVGQETHDYLVIERYDRVVTETGVRRLHQEDFCQALGEGQERKYEAEGGVSFPAVYRTLQDVSADPALDVLQLLRWQIFNYVAGNSDGHAKNLSLLYLDNRTIRLAPFYDLVCTRAIDSIDASLAFSVGGERVPGNIHQQHWQQLAMELRIRPKYMHSLVAEVAELVRGAIRITLEEFQTRHGEYPALQRVQQVIEPQCRRALRLAEAAGTGN